MPTITRRRPRQPAKERGTIYVLVLGVVMLLVVLGVAGVKVSQIKLERSGLQQDLAVATLVAENAIDVTHKQIDGTVTWRTGVGDNKWSEKLSYGGALVYVKYIDEIDGRMSDDPTQRFRLYTKAVVGEAVRVYSVEMIPDDSGNLTRNARTFRREAAVN